MILSKNLKVKSMFCATGRVRGTVVLICDRVLVF